MKRLKRVNCNTDYMTLHLESNENALMVKTSPTASIHFAILFLRFPLDLAYTKELEKYINY